MIFVTGGTGLLGAHLLYDLSMNGESIKAVYRDKSRIEKVKALFRYYHPANSDLLFEKIHWVKGDILDIPFLEEVMKDCSKVYHSAALVSFHPKDFNRLMDVNRRGTANIVNVSLKLGVDKLCYVSSTAAVGENNGGSITENNLWKKTPSTTGYSISKYSAEKEVWRGIEEGLKAVVVNPCVILGPGDWNESSLTIFKNMEKGRTYYPIGSNATVDARDVSEIMIKLMNSDISDERYLCIGSNQSFKDLMTAIAEELGVKAPKKEASRSMVSFARRIMAFGSFLTGNRSKITKENINSLYGDRSYDNSKIKATLQFNFRPLKETIQNSIAGRIN